MAPATRRSTRARPVLAKDQSTISFPAKVSKNSRPKATGRQATLLAPSGAAAVEAAAVEEVRRREEEAEVRPADVVRAETPAKAEGGPTPDEEKRKQPQTKSESEIAAAEEIGDAQIRSYMRNIEQGRLAPAVHQEELTLGEKVLRYFDVSSQYGPCIGISRTKRWKRAQKLGLDPPMEVLALLVQEESEGSEKAGTAHMEEIMNATAVGSG